MANLAPRWFYLARKWGPNSIQDRKKSMQKSFSFFDCFFDEVLEGFGSKKSPKSDAEIDGEILKKTNGPKIVRKIKNL